MIHLNYSNLNEETKEQLFQDSKKYVEQKFGTDIRNYAKQHFVNYNKMLEEEALRNLYNNKYIFNI